VKRILSIALVVVLAGCSSTKPQFNKMTQFQARKALYNHFFEEQSLESIKVIEGFSYSSYYYLDHEHLIIQTTSNESYLITLYLSCVDLDKANGINIHQETSSSLEVRKDAIGNINYPKQKCIIQSIHRLSQSQLEAAKGLAVESQSKWPDIEKIKW